MMIVLGIVIVDGVSIDGCPVLAAPPCAPNPRPRGRPDVAQVTEFGTSIRSFDFEERSVANNVFLASGSLRYVAVGATATEAALSSWTNAVPLAPMGLRTVGALSFSLGPRPRRALRAAGAATVATIVPLLGLIAVAVAGPLTRPLLGSDGLGLSVRLDPFSVAMFTLVAFVGLADVRYARRYRHGDARQWMFVGSVPLHLEAGGDVDRQARRISLQSSGSAIDNRAFGSGNKVLRDVVGTLGVLEGSGGDLHTGLPLCREAA